MGEGERLCVKSLRRQWCRRACGGRQAKPILSTGSAACASAGAILTKLDGDSRGGAALSVREVSGAPMEPFYPERMANRILGMGDMLTLYEKAQEAFKVGAAGCWMLTGVGPGDGR